MVAGSGVCRAVMSSPPGCDPSSASFDWSLPGGQDHYFKAIADLAAGGGFTDDKVMEINKRFNTDFPRASDTRGTAAHRE